MAGVQQVDLSLRQVAPEGGGARGDEGRIVGAPGDQGRRLVRAQPGLPCRVGGDVGSVVQEQRRLYLALARLRKLGELVGPRVRVVAVRMGGAGDVALPRRLEGKEGVHHLRVGAGIGPVLGDPGPFRAEPVRVGVAVLGDECPQPLRMRQHDAKAHRRTVVVDVEGVAADPELLQQVVGRPGEVVEGIGVRRGRRRVALPEAREVGCDHVEARGEQRDQRVELARGRREAVQQHDRRPVPGSRLTVEDPHPVHLRPMIAGGGRDGGQRRGRRGGGGQHRGGQGGRAEMTGSHRCAPVLLLRTRTGASGRVAATSPMDLRNGAPRQPPACRCTGGSG